MTNLMAGQALLNTTTGLRVSRATANLPATATQPIFTITGKVLLAAIFGEVTTVIQTQACNTKLQHDPTDAGANQDLCANLDITADAVGTMYSITGTPATAMQDSLNFVSADKMLARPMILKAGSISLVTGATNTGQVKWDVVYVPLENGAAIAAA